VKNFKVWADPVDDNLARRPESARRRIEEANEWYVGTGGV
jgi:hypothetical protein